MDKQSLRNRPCRLLSAQFMKSLSATLLLLSATAAWAGVQPARPGQEFLESRCYDCHDSETKKGNLDLTTLPFYLDDAKVYAMWVKVHDRVRDGEMPAEEESAARACGTRRFSPVGERADDRLRAGPRCEGGARHAAPAETVTNTRTLCATCCTPPGCKSRRCCPRTVRRFASTRSATRSTSRTCRCRATWRRPDYALRQVMATQVARPPTKTERFYARDQRVFATKMKFSVFNKSPERATFPLIGTQAQPDVRSGKLPLTVGDADPATRETEAMGVVASSYEPIELRFDKFKAPAAGRYKIRFSAYSVWVGPGPAGKWWHPDLDTVSAGRRPEPITIYSETPPRLLRLLGSFDVNPDPTIRELDTYLLAGEEIRPDAARLFRSRPPNYHNPLAEEDGQPGVAFRWMEVEGTDLRPVAERPATSCSLTVCHIRPRRTASRWCRKIPRRMRNACCARFSSGPIASPPPRTTCSVSSASSMAR